SAWRPSAGIAAAAVTLAAAGALSVPNAPAAQPGMAPHAAPVQHAAPMHRAAPVFRPAPVHHAPPRGTGGAPPMRPPLFAAPPGGVHAVNPGLHHVNPVQPVQPFHNPVASRPSLPLNNPSALRPNFPLHPRDAGYTPSLPGNGPTGNGPPAFANPNPAPPAT